MRKPAGRGKIERWFRTVRQQFLAPLEIDQVAGIADLDQRFHTWLESEYHRSLWAWMLRVGFSRCNGRMADRWPPIHRAPGRVAISSAPHLFRADEIQRPPSRRRQTLSPWLARLMEQLAAAERRLRVTTEYLTAAGRFVYLLEALHPQTGQRVAVLVDEYDKPILDALETPDTDSGEPFQ